MAVQVEVKLICDYCSGTEAGVQRATKTRRFGLDGQQMEVEVCDKHDTALDKALEVWCRVGRKAGSKPKEIGRQARRGAAKATTRRVGETYDKKEYILWAQMKGFKVDPEKRPNPRLLRQYLDDRAAKAATG